MIQAHMKSFIYAIFLFCIFSIDGRAESGGGGGFLLMPGVQEANLADLSQSLNDSGLNDFGNANPQKTAFTTIGAAGFGYNSGLLWGIEGHGMLTKTTKAANELSTRLDGWYAMLDIGPAYSNDKDFIFSPGLGLGGGEMALKFERNKTIKGILPDGQPIKDAEDEPNLNLTTALRANYALVTGHVDCLFGRPDGGLIFGIRGGYAYSIESASWRTTAGEKIADLPDFLMRGPFIRLSIGFGKI